MFGFPNPVNEKAARTVAAGVVLLCVLTLALSAMAAGWIWLTVVLAYGFVARVATGPTLSPLGQLATRAVAPRLGTPKLVAGPPKRFAQAVGATLSVLAAVLGVGFGQVGAAQVFVALILVAATLESVFAICLGCIGFAWFMRAGVIPESVCVECADISDRLHVPSGHAAS